MAVRPHIRVRLPGLDETSVALYEWAGLLNGDTGLPIPVTSYADKNFQVHGTSGVGMEAILEGDSSLTVDQWFPLRRADGQALLLDSAPSGAQVLDHTLYVRPRIAAGDGNTNVTALLYIIARK
jgi:hypothetical protein